MTDSTKKPSKSLPNPPVLGCRNGRQCCPGWTNVVCLVARSCSVFFVTLWTVAHQAPPSMRFFRHELRRRQWQPTPVLLPGKSHGRSSLVGYSPWGRLESDTTEQLHFHFSPSCTGEGNGNPLQCSCLEKPRDGGAWWAAISGVTQSWTWLKRLSSSSSSTKLDSTLEGWEKFLSFLES